VFETALMLLFTTCVYCTAITKNVKKVVTGSSLQITQFCLKCKRKRIWKSQAFIGNIPAGNILTSAAILFSGSIPAKALQMFHILDCRTITRSTFFRHQTNYLQPTISLVWKRHQNTIFDRIKAESRSVIVAGDGRADSPGHSAK
jgi:solute carrier family 8 (sodium/calcium exchanger)